MIENGSSFASADWGFRVRPADPIELRRKGRWSGRSAHPEEFLAETSCRTPISTPGPGSGGQRRNHGTLKERPVDRFEREREYLIGPWPYHSNVVPGSRRRPRYRRRTGRGRWMSAPSLDRVCPPHGRCGELPLPPRAHRRPACGSEDAGRPGALDGVHEVDGGARIGDPSNGSWRPRSPSHSRRLEAAMRSSRLPAIKTLRRLQLPAIDQTGAEATRCRAGPWSEGKTSSWVRPEWGRQGIGHQLGDRGAPRAAVVSTTRWWTLQLEEAKAGGRLNHRLKTLTYPALLVVDEIGYLPIGQSGATGEPALRAGLDGVDEQGLRGMGPDPGRRGDGGSASGPHPAPLPHRQHPGQQLPAAPPRRASRAIHPTAARAVRHRNPEREGGRHEGTRSGRGSPRGGRSAPFTGAPAMCAIFSGQKCAIFGPLTASAPLTPRIGDKKVAAPNRRQEVAVGTPVAQRPPRRSVRAR